MAFHNATDIAQLAIRLTRTVLELVQPTHTRGAPGCSGSKVEDS